MAPRWVMVAMGTLGLACARGSESPAAEGYTAFSATQPPTSTAPATGEGADGRDAAVGGDAATATPQSIAGAAVRDAASPDAGAAMGTAGAAAAPPWPDPRWAAVTTPAPGAPRSLGGYARGCIQGAVPLEDAAHLVVMRRSRRRYFGHPDLVAFLQRLAAASHRKGLGPLFVGDLGQARGGPTLTGHASHQSGLDVDVLFLSPRADGKALTAADREALPARAVVDLRTFAFTPHYTPRVLTLVGLAAADPVVDRIFVHPALKRRLCDEQRGAPWQGRVRPWWGHHDHLHVRLRCPAGDTGCEGQPPLTGDGCDKGLAWWFSAESKAGPKKDPTAPPPQLPAACEALVTGGAAAP